MYITAYSYIQSINGGSSEKCMVLATAMVLVSVPAGLHEACMACMRFKQVRHCRPMCASVRACVCMCMSACVPIFFASYSI